MATTSRTHSQVESAPFFSPCCCLHRLSAARSKMKQRVAQQGLRAQVDMLTRQRDRLVAELATLKHMCRELEAGAP